MYPEHQHFKEAAHIGEELFDDEFYELERNCQSIKRGLDGKVFTLEDGLKAYNVSREKYEEFFGR